MALSSPKSKASEQLATGYEDDQVLKSVVAYVEVRAEDEDRSDAISHFLHLLGAHISKYFNRKVTHVVFNNGKHSTYKKAKLWGVHLVSVSWIERCKRSNSIVQESDYPAIIPEEFMSPFFCGKSKKFKSMVPKIIDFDITKSLEKQGKRREQRRIKRECREFLKMTPTLQAEFKPRIKRFKFDEIRSDSGKIEMALAKRRFSADVSSDLSDENGELDEHSWNVPLAERLLNRSLSASFSASLNGSFAAITQSPLDSTTKTPTGPTTKPGIGKRKLFIYSDKLLNITPDAPRSKPTKSTPTIASASPALQQADSSLSDFQLTANKENEPKKIHKVLKTFDQETPPDDDTTKSQPRKLVSNTRFVPSPIMFTRTPSIVLTSVGKEETESLTEIVAGVGGFNVVVSVDETTTHVVCGNPRRTLNVLFGLARGCWIVSQDWVYESLDKGRWLPEKDYELSTEFPGCAQFRLERRKSSAYRQNIFRVVGPMFIGDEISIPKKKLQNLITLCGGRVVSKCKMAAICIGCEDNSKKDSTALTEKWILDSITHNKLQPMDNFKMNCN